MSKEIKILECAKCGRELYRKEEGEIENPNGVYAINTEWFKVDEK